MSLKALVATAGNTFGAWVETADEVQKGRFAKLLGAKENHDLPARIGFQSATRRLTPLRSSFVDTERDKTA